MNLVKRMGSPEELGWRCPRRGCRNEVTLRKVKVDILYDYENYPPLRNKILDHSHSEIQVILRLLHLWSVYKNGSWESSG